MQTTKTKNTCHNKLDNLKLQVEVDIRKNLQSQNGYVTSKFIYPQMCKNMKTFKKCLYLKNDFS